MDSVGHHQTLEKIMSPDGTPIACWRSGDGPPLVLVHGSINDHTRWETVLPLLEPHATVYAVDRRGCGASGDASEYSLVAEARDIAAVVDAIAGSRGGPVDVLGHSFGALCVLEATLLTGNIRRLMLYEPALRALMPPGFAEEMQELLAQGCREDVVTAVLAVVGMSDQQVELVRSLPSWPARVAAAHTIVRETRVEDAYAFDAARFAAMRVPTLLLTGSESPPDVAESTPVLAGALPAARVAELDGQGHAAMLTAPELFAAEVLAFLQDDGR